MKRTRTLVLALALASFTPVFADVKYDALRRQEIITVTEGRTISNSAASFTVDLAQEQIGKKTNNRTAIVKDGQGTLVLDQDVDMFCSLVVREGTLLIKDTAVTDHPYVESPVLTVGGINAQVVLDNATFTQSLKYNRGYVAAVCVGGRDGDGTFTLQNGAEFSHTQTMYVGGLRQLQRGRLPLLRQPGRGRHLQPDPARQRHHHPRAGTRHGHAEPAGTCRAGCPPQARPVTDFHNREQP